MYANPNNRLSSVGATGRLDEDMSADMKGRCFFPNRLVSDGLHRVAGESGVLYILAFDRVYHDNAGSYEVRHLATIN